jgi:short-subunit dehydrogenase
MALCPGPVRTEFQKTAKSERMRLPSFVWTEAERVVNNGIAAAASGHAVHVAGVFNSAMVLASKLTPRALTTFISAAVMRPPAADK